MAIPPNGGIYPSSLASRQPARFLREINKSSSCRKSRLFLDDTPPIDLALSHGGWFARFSISRHVPQIRFVFLDASSSIPTVRGIRNIKLHFYIPLTRRIFPTDVEIIPRASRKYWEKKSWYIFTCQNDKVRIYLCLHIYPEQCFN